MAMLADFLVSKLLETLFDMAKEELARQMGLIEDVNKLRNTLTELECYLQDAENKSLEITSINQWLNKIKDVMYDIDDVLDEYYTLKVYNDESIISSSHDESSSSSTKVCCYFPVMSCFRMAASNHQIGVQIQDLNKKLKDEIMTQIPGLQLMSSVATAGPVANQITQNQQVTSHVTTSVVVRSDIVGNRIHDDARRLVEWLTKEDDRDNLLVYAIVGMGGIGKTTLAKLVFHDHMIKSRFDPVKAWVGVSQNYNEIDALRNIITSAGGDVERCHDKNSLIEKVKDTVQGKRLFMVLDDVWETRELWKGLLGSLLKSGAAKGSRVLVTTRSQEIANQMFIVDSLLVQPLLLEDGWSLLCNSAFPPWEQQKAKNNVWNLKDIGIELVKKCDGLPLAIDVIGGMLSEERTREAWELVLKSSVWEVIGLPKEIHSALYLSYQSLPANIRQCFLYCSLFPKGRYFRSYIAKDLWIQEGLIKDETNISSYDDAERSLKMLTQRNLLKHDPNSPIKKKFIMHDLVYSLSRFLMQNESVVATEEIEILNSGLSGRSTMKLRRLSFIDGGNKTISILPMQNESVVATEEKEILNSGLSGRSTMKLRLLSLIDGCNKTMSILPKSLQEQVSLRSLLIFDKSICKIDNDLFNHIRHLRILFLRKTNVMELPASIGALKQLRYLNLSETPIRELPKTIQNLKTLRVLDVEGCVNLYNLPSCIMNLYNLCTLYIMNSACYRLPPGLGRLNKLQNLEFIVPPKDIAQKSSTIKELGTLTELRYLHLFKLERVLDRSEAKSVALKDKQHLRTLKLHWSESDSNEVLVHGAPVNIIEEIFEDLYSPHQLQDLQIANYYGSKLPSWLGHASSNSLLNLLIDNCSNCKQLDGLGLLTNLEILEIKGASSIKSIGPEFYKYNSRNNIEKGALEPSHQNFVFLPRIKLLALSEMDSLEEWSCLGKAIPVMPHLETLFIYSCPKLKSFPEELLHHAAASLKEITIRKTDELLLKVVHNLPCLEKLNIENFPNLERISELPALQELWIVDCPGIKLVELTHRLRNITWTDFNTDSLPGWLSIDGNEDDNKLKATDLQIFCNEELVRKICFNKENEVRDFSKIQHLDHITVFDKDECLRLAYTKNPSSFTVYPGKTQGETFHVDLRMKSSLPLF